MKKVYSLSVSFLFIIFITLINLSCNKNIEDGKICGMLPLNHSQESEFGSYAVAINGDEFPYYSVYVDDDNYSQITQVQLAFDKDGTWESKILFWERKEGGDPDFNTVESDGTYSCSAAGIVMEETDGTDAGLFHENTNPNVDAEWVLSSGSNEYYF